jgi:hypothetical protein
MKPLGALLMAACATCSTNLFAQAALAEAEAALPASIAQQQFKLLTKEKRDEIARERGKEIRAEALKLPPKQNAETRPAAENILKLEEIRVFGKVDPEDYVPPKPAPMLQFRATLDGQRPRTPYESTMQVVCFFIACIPYDKNGNPIIDYDPAHRQLMRKNATTVELSQMRGTLQ